jgi:hypothetical protein
MKKLSKKNGNFFYYGYRYLCGKTLLQVLIKLLTLFSLICNGIHKFFDFFGVAEKIVFYQI